MQTKIDVLMFFCNVFNSFLDASVGADSKQSFYKYDLVKYVLMGISSLTEIQIPLASIDNLLCRYHDSWEEIRQATVMRSLVVRCLTLESNRSRYMTT